jgi:FkbM family methyltransferase
MLQIHGVSSGCVGDADIFDEVIIDDVYKALDVIIPGCTVLDIGSHIGCFSFWALELGAKTVFCIEPELRNVNQLEKNAALNPGCDIRIIFGAVASVGYKLEFNSENSGAHRMGLAFKKSDDIRQSPPIISHELVDELIKKNNVTVLKLDCEGQELFLLQGVKNIRLLKVIVLEVHDYEFCDKMNKSVIKVLEDSGFDVKVLSYASNCEGGFSVIQAVRI